MVGAVLVSDGDEIMLVTDGGTLVRTHVAEVSVMSRNTQGVKLISLTEGEKLVALERIAESEEEEANEDSPAVDSVEEAGNDGAHEAPGEE